MLVLRQLAFDYPEQDYCFDMNLMAGQCLAVQGPSGAGKSTLLNLIAGFLSACSGEIGWLTDGSLIRWNSLLPWQQPVTTVFQEHNLFEHLPLWANIGMGLHPGLKLNGAQRQQIEQVLDDVGLAGMADRLPGALSGGQRQRVALARAWLRQKPLLLLDEPFTGLDVHTREQMWAGVKRQCAAGVAVLLVSHDSEDLDALADKRLRLEKGMLVAS